LTLTGFGSSLEAYPDVKESGVFSSLRWLLTLVGSSACSRFLAVAVNVPLGCSTEPTSHAQRFA